MKRAIILISIIVSLCNNGVYAQTFHLFSPQMKSEYPSVVYDFLERYLYEIDSLQRKGVYLDLRLQDDKVMFLTGTPSIARSITPETAFCISKFENKFFQVAWTDSLGNTIFEMAFPMQYELLLGKPKVDLEKEFKDAIVSAQSLDELPNIPVELKQSDDNCFMTDPISHYYVESLNTATYFTKNADGEFIPTFVDSDKWHSASNLFQGYIDDVEDYTLYIEQNVYGFKKIQYTVSLKQWLNYCRTMKLKTYFAIEEEREDGLKALLIAQSEDLGFNHMMSLIIPDNFVTNKKTVFKTTLNTYIPTQNVKDLYKQYVDKPKKQF